MHNSKDVTVTTVLTRHRHLSRPSLPVKVVCHDCPYPSQSSIAAVFTPHSHLSRPFLPVTVIYRGRPYASQSSIAAVLLSVTVIYRGCRDVIFVTSYHVIVVNFRKRYLLPLSFVDVDVISVIFAIIIHCLHSVSDVPVSPLSSSLSSVVTDILSHISSTKTSMLTL